MILKSKILEKGPLVLTGSKVLKSIMDKTTPPADLFIREVIQNSLDAILPEKEFGKISINIGSFNNVNLCNSLDGINEVLYRQMGDEEFPFISISDSNTCGLLGKDCVKGEVSFILLSLVLLLLTLLEVVLAYSFSLFKRS